MCRYRWSRCFGPTDVTDTDGCRCSENKKVTDADACRCFGSTDVFRDRCLRCLWFTDVLPILMPNICWCIRYGRRKFPDSDRKFPGSQRSEGHNPWICGFPRVNPDFLGSTIYMCRYRCLPMFWSTNVYRCRCLPMFVVLRCLPMFWLPMFEVDRYFRYISAKIYMLCGTLQLMQDTDNIPWWG